MERGDSMLIKESEIRRIVSDRKNYSLTKQYSQFGFDSIEKLTITYNEISEQFDVDCEYSSYYGTNHIEISITRYGAVLMYRCDCRYCTSRSACAHIGATLYFIYQLDDDTPLPFYYDFRAYREELMRKREEELKRRKLLESEQNTQSFIAYFKEKTMNQIELRLKHDLYQLHMEIKDAGYDQMSRLKVIKISFKIGNQKQYVIKNIEEFINCIDGERFFKYGKDLEFIHHINGFDEASIQQIEFIKRCIHVQKSKYYYQWSKITRELSVGNDMLDEFFDLYNDIGYEYSNVSFLEEDARIPLQFTKDSYNLDHIFYQIHLNEEEYGDDLYLGKHHIYQSDFNTLRRYRFDDNGKGLTLFSHLLIDGDMMIKEEDLGRFFKFILSDIKDYFIVLGIDPNTFIQEESQIRLYGDVDDEGQIYVTLTYIYDDEKKEGFQENNDQLSLTCEIVETHIKKYASVIDYDSHTAYFDDINDRAYLFIKEGLPFLTQYCEIFVSDALKNMGTTQKINISIGVNIVNNLLEIDIDSVEVHKEELFDILKSYRKKRKFHRLKNGKLLNLESNELEEFDQMSVDFNVSSKDMKDGKIQLPAYRAFSMDEMADRDQHIEFKRNDNFKTLINDFKNTDQQVFDLPQLYEPILRDYQKFGFQWLKQMSQYGFGGILADDMGLGKTLQVIALLESEKDSKQPSIVICPASILLNWQDEINKFSSNLSCKCIYGSVSERQMAIKSVQDYDVIITSYDYIRRDVELYQDIQFQYVILDEAQFIKNQKTKNAISVKRLKARMKFALTGTPIENSLAELWSIFDFLMPNYLYNYHYFQSNFERKIVKDQDEEVSNKLKRMVEPFILRRNKKDVLKELPDKIEQTLSITFNEEEHKLYLANLMQVNKELQEKLEVEKMDRFAVLAMLTRLRQICCEPRLLFENVKETSSKLKACMELVDTFHQSHKKVLLFSAFTSVLDLIADELHDMHITYYKLTGSTDKEERRRLVQQFQSDSTEVFLISLKAGGTGLNLTAAEAVIHFDPWWNVSAQNQATDRAYRIGQNNNVQVFKLIMKDSIEEKIQELQEKKKNLADTFVENNQGTITSMSKEDIINLLKV